MRRTVLYLHGFLSRILLPPSFRVEYGEELRCAVQARLESGQGAWDVAGVASLELFDVLRTSSREWASILRVESQGLVQGIWLDLRIAIRGLAKAPTWSVIVIATLAVSIGANTAVFSVVDGVLLRPLPFPEEEELVIVRAGLRRDVAPRRDISFSDRGYWHFVENNRVFEAFGGYKPVPSKLDLLGEPRPIQVRAGRMTGSLFQLLGVVPALGRLPSAEEDSPGGPRVALLGHDLWTTQYGSDAKILGRSITLNGRVHAVVAVMPQGYDFPTPGIDLWIPLQLDPASTNFEGHHIEGLGRLAPGSTTQAALVDAEGLILRFGELGYGDEWFADVFDGTATMTPLRERIIGGSRRPLLILFGTIAMVLLIACSNVANLVMVRAEGQTRENAVRLALGSSRIRLVRRSVIESVLTAMIGGSVGCLLAFLATGALVAGAPASIPRLDQIGVSWMAMGFATVISLAVGLLVGVIPALQTGSRRLLGVLATGARAGLAAKRQHRTRSVLVIAQVALALILVVGSGLMVRSFQALRSVDPGFQAQGVLTFALRPTPSKYGGAEGVAQFYDQLLDRLGTLPGVIGVGAITILPLQGQGPLGAREIEEYPTVEGEIAPVYHLRRATPGYFAAMGIPLVEGRPFEADDHNLRLGSIIISNSLKQHYWPNTSALGKRISGSTIVGVVGDIHGAGLDAEIQETIYSAMLDSVGGGVRSMTVVVATEPEHLGMVPDVRHVVAELDSDLPVTQVRSMTDVVDASLSRMSVTMTALSLAAMIAVFLAAVGIYGVLSYLAACRTSEMGVRLALGADSASVRRLILSQGLTLAALGTALGLAGALLFGRALSSLLFEIDPSDPLTLIGVAVIFLIIATAASLIPAVRAGRTPPAEALRIEG